MGQKSSEVPVSEPAAFARQYRATEKHIIDVLIEERCPSFVRHWTWFLVRPILLITLGYGRAVRWADHIKDLGGADVFNYLSEQLELEVTATHLNRVPEKGRAVVIANHPTGLADGVAVWTALKKVRQDIMFFANADAMRVVPGFTDTIIPVEWVMNKRSPSKTRETLRLAGEAFDAEKCIVIFPSGKLAKMTDGHLTEQEWFSTALALARKRRAPIVPLNVTARNSPLYYLLSRINNELRDITLFKELLNKKGARFEMTIGPPIMPEALDSRDLVELTEALREYVSCRLPQAPDEPFTV